MLSNILFITLPLLILFFRLFHSFHSPTIKHPVAQHIFFYNNIANNLSSSHTTMQPSARPPTKKPAAILSVLSSELSPETSQSIEYPLQPSTALLSELSTTPPHESSTALPSDSSTKPPSVSSTKALPESSTQPPVESSKTKKPASPFDVRLNHLLQSGAFRKEKFPRAPRHAVQRMLQRWQQRQKGLQISYSPLNYQDLKRLKNSRTLPVQDPDLLKTFPVIASSPDSPHHCLKDHNGNILAYRFRYPDHLLKKLEESQHLLPAGKVTDTIRGNFHHRHYALWADYSPDIMKSKEYRDDHPSSQAWLDANKELFEYLSDNLRMIDPDMYTMFTSIDKYLPAGFARMAGAWHAVAINETMVPQTTELETHLDWQDINYGYNAVLPWGNFGGGYLIFWQAKIIYEVCRGDCLLFMGSVIAHQVSEITSGMRNSIDLFCHKSTMDWKRRMDVESGVVHKYT